MSQKLLQLVVCDIQNNYIIMNINTKYYAAYIGDLAMYTSYNIDFDNLDDL